MKNLQIQIPIELHYSNKKHVPIRDIIKSLEGIEGLTHQLYTVASEVIGFDLKASKAQVENIESGSLHEKIFILLFFKSEEDFEKFVNEFGEEHPVIRSAIAAIFTAIFLYGCYQAISSNNGDTTNIEGNNNVVINIKNQQLTADDIKQIIEKNMPDKTAAVKSSLKFAAPAKMENGASINIRAEGLDGDVGHTIEHNLISKIPNSYKDPIVEKILHIDNAEISIRAIDLDKRNQGWAGRVSGIDKRLPISIAPNVDITKLRDTTVVDVSIIYKKNDDNDNLKPTRVYIENLSGTTDSINLAKTQLTQEEASKIEDVKISSQSNFADF